MLTITTNLKKEYGTYDATFTVFNGPFKTVKNLKVKVVDKESPVITLEGDNEVKLCKIEDYKEAGYKPYIIAAMMFLSKVKDPVATLKALSEGKKPRFFEK